MTGVFWVKLGSSMKLAPMSSALRMWHRFWPRSDGATGRRSGLASFRFAKGPGERGVYSRCKILNTVTPEEPALASKDACAPVVTPEEPALQARAPAFPAFAVSTIKTGRCLFPKKTFDQSGKNLYQSASNHATEYHLSSTRGLKFATEMPPYFFGKASIYGLAERSYCTKCGTCHIFCRAKRAQNQRQV